MRTFPARAVELHGLTEAPWDERHQGSRKKAQSLGCAPPLRRCERRNPRCFHASLLPTSLGLIGRLHGDRDLNIELRLRRCDGGPPFEPRTNWEDRVPGATAPPETFAQVQPARFDRPTGGTAEFLGRVPRCSARSAREPSLAERRNTSAGSRRAARRDDPTPDMCLVPPSRGNRNDRTSRRQRSLVAARLANASVQALEQEKQKRGEDETTRS